MLQSVFKSLIIFTSIFVSGCSSFDKSELLNEKEKIIMTQDTIDKVDQILKKKGNLGPSGGDFSAGLEKLRVNHRVKLEQSAESESLVMIEVWPKENVTWGMTATIDLKSESIENAVTETIEPLPEF
ncbi:MAG: hypothetical protein AB8E15_06450 [Bdellovibrionales bacterium]